MRFELIVRENALLVSQATNQIEVIGELLQRGLNWKRLFDRVKWANRSWNQNWVKEEMGWFQVKEVTYVDQLGLRKIMLKCKFVWIRSKKKMGQIILFDQK